jgi:hypothetical protein
MTIRSIGLLAAQRDAQGRAALAAPPAPLLPTPAVAPATTAGPVAPPAGTLDTLSASIPSDVAAGYTTVIGVLAGALKGGASTYLPLRWWLYSGCLVGTIVSAIVSYRTATTKPRARKLPWAEATTAAFAFAFWGLIVPQSPLYVNLTSPLLPIVVALLSVGGVFLVTSVLKPALDKPTKIG